MIIAHYYPPENPNIFSEKNNITNAKNAKALHINKRYLAFQFFWHTDFYKDETTADRYTHLTKNRNWGTGSIQTPFSFFSIIN